MATVVGADLSFNTRGRFRETTSTLVFTGNYPDEGEPLTPAAVGLGTIIDVEFDGPVRALDGETSVLPRYNVATQKIEMYESAATGLPLIEKTAGEPHITGANVRMFAIGY